MKCKLTMEIKPMYIAGDLVDIDEVWMFYRGRRVTAYETWSIYRAFWNENGTMHRQWVALHQHEHCVLPKNWIFV